MADAWGGAWGQSWGVSWGYSEQATLGAGGGRYRYWAPVKEPKKRKKREEKIAVIEAVVSQPVADIDLSALSDQLKVALEAAVPDYRSVISKAKSDPLPETLREEADQFRQYAEAIAEEAKAFAVYQTLIEEEAKVWDEAKKQRRKELLAKKRERNQKIIQMLLH